MELEDSQIELDISLAELKSSVIHHTHLESSLIELESYPVELKSSLIKLVSSPIE